jgi:glycosyltransferase involved in cell wall biosynthesis
MRVVQLLGRSTGGIGTQVADLSRELRRLGDEVVVVTDPLTASRFDLPQARLWWPGRATGVVGSARDLWRLRRVAVGADVLHAHGHQAGLLATLVTIATRTPVVVSQHNDVVEAGGARALLSRWVQWFVAHRAALVTGASSDLVDAAQRHGARRVRLAPVPSPRVPELLARHTLDADERRGQAAELLRENGVDAPPGSPLVLTIARIAPQKDLWTLVDAAAPNSLTRPRSPGQGSAGSSSPVWVVVGGGDARLRNALVERVDAVGAPVHFVGPQPDPDRWLRAADVFALSSRWEARALVVQEAMAAGTPVVGTDAGGLRDLLDGAGVLVPVGDPEALARAVHAVLDDPSLRARLSAEGRERAATWDDSTTTARRWHQWYTALPSMT